MLPQIQHWMDAFELSFHKKWSPNWKYQICHRPDDLLHLPVQDSYTSVFPSSQDPFQILLPTGRDQNHLCKDFLYCPKECFQVWYRDEPVLLSGHDSTHWLWMLRPYRFLKYQKFHSLFHLQDSHLLKI